MSSEEAKVFLWDVRKYLFTEIIIEAANFRIEQVMAFAEAVVIINDCLNSLER